MNRQEFIDALRQRLSEAGFSAEYVATQCNTLTEKLNSLSDETAAQYTTERNLDIIVRKLISQDAAQLHAAPAEDSDQSEAQESSAAPAAPAKQVRADVQFVDEDSLSPDRRSVRPSAAASEYVPCDKPRLLAALLGILCAPTVFLVLAAAVCFFGGAFMLLAASIFLIVVAIVAIAGVGSVTSVVALLYGATQVLSTPRYVGFHELGFGLLVAGITMAASILLYNAAIRLIPFIYVQMGKLLKFSTRKLVSFAKNAVKGVEQL